VAPSLIYTKTGDPNGPPVLVSVIPYLSVQFPILGKES